MVYYSKRFKAVGSLTSWYLNFNEANEGSFTKADIVSKLFSPQFMTGSERKSHQFYCDYNLSAINL